MSDPNATRITKMRAQRTASLRETCVVTPAVAPGGTPVPFTVTCNSYIPQGSMDGGGGAAITRRARRSIAMPWGTVIKTGDRFTWNGRTLEVADVVDPVTNSTAVHTDCIEVVS